MALVVHLLRGRRRPSDFFWGGGGGCKRSVNFSPEFPFVLSENLPE